MKFHFEGGFDIVMLLCDVFVCLLASGGVVLEFLGTRDPLTIIIEGTIAVAAFVAIIRELLKVKGGDDVEA